ncbi:MAG: hypothetical protein R3255_03085 [Candidatus Lokiarchaeia archaeon]|nr:hypothetical protein [Candidatus Lokiarchaeia archaeon]
MIKKTNGQNKFIFTILILLNLFLISNSFISFSNAQINGEPFSFSSDFGFTEYCQIGGLEENVSSIQIELPEPNWTISNIQINFSDIKMGSENKIIEESESGFSPFIYNKNPAQKQFALSTQIEILEVTDLLGVYIKGYKTPEANETIKFQVQGFDENNLHPNGTILRTIDLNMSTTEGVWYYQDFSSNPITLPIGNYSLVMNGTSLPTNSYARYFWDQNNFDPQIPYLSTSSYISSWSPGAINTSFLCKLNQRIDRSYFPSVLNMTAQFNGDNYEITDGSDIGKGLLNLPDLTYYSEEIDLNIPIMINQSLILNYNYNYSFNLNHNFTTIGSAVVKESKNEWSLLPTINRITSNYYVKLINLPKSWYNLTLYRILGPIRENVTSDMNVDFNKNTIIIPNRTILDGTELELKANSPNTPFNINPLDSDWERGTELQFTVDAPSAKGNLTFFLIDQYGYELGPPLEIKEDVSGENILFSYLIPSTTYVGPNTIIIYWNNNTDAGVQSEEINVFVIIPPPNLTWIFILVAIIIIIGTTVGLISYRTIKKYRIRKIEEEQKLFHKCMDVLNLYHVIVSDKKSGLNIYQQDFTEHKIDAAMISGFLQAIHNFGIELIKIEDSSQTIKLEYKDSIIIMTEFVNIRLILIMKAAPSSNFLYSLEDLAYDVYKYFGELIDTFNGDIKPFRSIEKLLKQHLNTTLTYPTKLTELANSDKIRINPSGREMISKARSIMKKRNSDTFYLSSLLLEKECSPKDLETVLNLIDKKIIEIIE